LIEIPTFGGLHIKPESLADVDLEAKILDFCEEFWPSRPNANLQGLQIG
jgi:hypothetical protein